MFYSIVVASFNRQDEIVELVHSFENLHFPVESYELLIVDDGSTDGTRQFLDSYLPQAVFNIRYVKQENRGPGAARNLGIRNAHGQFFIFIEKGTPLLF